MTQKNLKQEIFRLASENIPPREIELNLNLPPYKIHERFHHELMEGYLEAHQAGLMNSLGDKSEKVKKLEEERNKLIELRRELMRERARKYREKHQARINELQRKRYQKRKQMFKAKRGEQ